jgi:hypothetical protein
VHGTHSEFEFTFTVAALLLLLLLTADDVIALFIAGVTGMLVALVPLSGTAHELG